MIIIKKLHNLIKKRQGFVLVDAMIAVLVLAIGLAALATVFTHGIGVMTKSTGAEKAVQLASAQIEKVKVKAQGTDKSNTGLLTYSDLQDYVDGINATSSETTQTIDNTNEKFTVQLKLSQDNLAKTSNNTKGDQYVYPLTATVTWTNSAGHVETIDLGTYVTVKEE